MTFATSLGRQGEPAVTVSEALLVFQEKTAVFSSNVISITYIIALAR
jgi:hypothetical protein